MSFEARPSSQAPPASAAVHLVPFIEAMLHAVWLVDARSLTIVAANLAAGDLYGLGGNALIGKPVMELAATPEDQCFWDEVASGLAHEIESETVVRRVDGGASPVLRRVSRIGTPADGAVYVVALHDRSEQVRTEQALQASAMDLQATLESTADGILVTDLTGRIRNFNQRFAALWDVPGEMLVRRNDDEVFDWMRRSVAEPSAYMRRLAALDETSMARTSDVLKLNSGRLIERVILPQSGRGGLNGRVYSFRDITEQVAANQRIDVLSYSDALTGLPNRRRLADRIEQALATAQRDGTAFALLFLNLDHFTHINQTLGHEFGDRVLLDVAERIQGCLRQVDTVARLGGDEFVLLVQQADTSGAEATARRVIASLQAPFVQGGLSFTVTGSIGISLYPNDGASMDELVSHADMAMHRVKDAGRAGFRFHQRKGGAAVDARSRTRMQLDHAMRQALVQGHFRLHYQPQVDMHSGDVLGAEALIRWRDPELGDVAPGEFIPVAEESGFIIAIGDWVLRQAVKQAAAWQAKGIKLVVSVNVSALQFQQPGFVEGVATALREAGVPPRFFELELTESILIQDAPEALLRLQALAQLGVKLAIDDFGTGYSSLGYLKRFPIGRLKIDRSFIDGLPGDASDAGIVHAIINMGRALNLRIIAEGVETEAQHQFLRHAGCEQFQGFLYAPALEAVAFEARLNGSSAARRRMRLVKS